MIKTKKIYYENIRHTDFEAKVLQCLPDPKTGLWKIVLDQTAFFPEGGGQAADKGFLEGQSVLDVQIQDDIIYHYAPDPIPQGRTVTGRVDWAQRFDFMQQHTGEHIISGLVSKHYGYDNVGFHLGLADVTLDFNGSLSMEQLRAIEAEANGVLWQNLPVLARFPSAQSLSQMHYRSKIELSGNIRIIEIPGIDVCACCAPHVERTGQVGLIKIINVQSHRGGIRVNILCGGRALADYTRKQEAVSDISVLLSARADRVADAVKRLQEENYSQKAKINSLQAQLLSCRMQTLPSPCLSQNALLFADDMDAIAMRNAVNALTEKYIGYCGIFAGNDKTGYRFVIGSKKMDCRELAQKLREHFQAKGGGSSPMIQGSICASEQNINSFFQDFQ